MHKTHPLHTVLLLKIRPQVSSFMWNLHQIAFKYTIYRYRICGRISAKKTVDLLAVLQPLHKTATMSSCCYNIRVYGFSWQNARGPLSITTLQTSRDRLTLDKASCINFSHYFWRIMYKISTAELLWRQQGSPVQCWGLD